MDYPPAVMQVLAAAISEGVQLHFILHLPLPRVQWYDLFSDFPTFVHSFFYLKPQIWSIFAFLNKLRETEIFLTQMFRPSVKLYLNNQFLLHAFFHFSRTLQGHVESKCWQSKERWSLSFPFTHSGGMKVNPRQAAMMINGELQRSSFGMWSRYTFFRNFTFCIVKSVKYLRFICHQTAIGVSLWHGGSDKVQF